MMHYTTVWTKMNCKSDGDIIYGSKLGFSRTMNSIAPFSISISIIVKGVYGGKNTCPNINMSQVSILIIFTY